MRTERVTVSMPADQADELRRAVAARRAESVSSYVAEAVRDRLARERAMARLREAWGELPSDAITWARHALGVDAGGGAEARRNRRAQVS